MTALRDPLLLLAATLAVEVPIALALAPRRARAATWRTALFVNLVSHPAATWLTWQGGEFLAVELLVVAFELPAYILVARLPPQRALVIAVLANTVTAVAGTIIGWTMIVWS